MNDKDMKTKIAKGTLVNFLGIIAKLLTPLYFIVITQLYGPAVVGVYLLANTIIEMGINFTFSGFKDGILLYTSRHVEIKTEHDIIYRVIVNAFFVIFILFVVAVTLAYTAGPWIVSEYFEHEGLANALKIMSISLPFLAIPQITVAATKAKMIMKYDVILIGTLRPLLMMLIAIGMYFVKPGIAGIASAYLVSNIIVTAVALPIFNHHFSFQELFKRVRNFRFYPPLLSFSLPQNLNMTLTYFTSGVSVLMLGTHDISKALIAFYGTGAEIVRQVKQVKIAFSTAFTPVISRLHRENRMKELEVYYSQITRWIVSIVGPVLIAGLAFKEQFLLVFHETYTYDSSFMIVLSLGTFAGCAFGIANNMVVMTGHSLMNLINSLFVGGAAFLFNWLFIPIWGLEGAAAATSLAFITNISITNIEIYLLYGIHLRLSHVYKPFLSCIIASIVFLAVQALPMEGVVMSAITAAFSLGTFAISMLIMGVPEEDKAVLTSFVNKKKGKQ
ncbi:MAG: oligosaccharide flippase family protein [bacterium]